MKKRLLQRWNSLAVQLGFPAQLAASYWQQLLQHYERENRHYHNLTHLDDLFLLLDTFQVEVADLPVLACSIWYHDIIYDVQRKDNEEQSALVAQQCLSGSRLSVKRIDQCIAQILATKTHELDTDDPDTAYLLDFDLAVLARPWPAYLLYAQQIRQEYQIYPDDPYLAGRKIALQRFLDRPYIYKTESFRSKFEVLAKANIKREVERLHY